MEKRLDNLEGDRLLLMRELTGADDGSSSTWQNMELKKKYAYMDMKLRKYLICGRVVSYLFTEKRIITDPLVAEKLIPS